MFHPPRLVKRKRNNLWWFTLMMATLAGTAAGRCLRQQSGAGIAGDSSQCGQGKAVVPGAFNAYGSEGPKHASMQPKVPTNREPTRGRQSRGAPSVEVLGGADPSRQCSRQRSPSLLPDPEWCDVAAPPSASEYAWFDTPRNFSNGMFSDRARWARECPLQVASAITKAISGIVVPRILDYEVWRDHAAAFFKRLCAHRRAMHDRWNRAMAEFSRRLTSTENRVSGLEQRLADVEARLARGVPFSVTSTDPRHHEDRNISRRGRSPAAHLRSSSPDHGRSRERSIPEKILDAQLTAIGKRSDSPGPDALRALEAHTQTYGSPFPSSASASRPAPHASTDPNAGRLVGRLRSHSIQSGYGFIECPQTFSRFGRDEMSLVYVRSEHLGEIPVGTLVTFECDTGPGGLPQAAEIRPTTDQQTWEEVLRYLHPNA